jgi:hypothetical protein
VVLQNKTPQEQELVFIQGFISLKTLLNASLVVVDENGNAKGIVSERDFPLRFALNLITYGSIRV